MELVREVETFILFLQTFFGNSSYMMAVETNKLVFFVLQAL